MKDIDRLYRTVISHLFDIELNTKEEIDSFYENIQEHLTKEQMEVLQSKIAECLHEGSCVYDEGVTEETHCDPPRLDKLRVISKFSFA